MIRLDPSTHADLLNWAKFARIGALPHPMPPTRAMSAEGRYVAEAGDVWGEPDDKPVFIDKERGAKIQALYESGRLSPIEKRVIQAEYPHRDRYMVKTKAGRARFDRGIPARRLGLPLRVYCDMLRRVVFLVELTLRED